MQDENTPFFPDQSGGQTETQRQRVFSSHHVHLWVGLVILKMHKICRKQKHKGPIFDMLRGVCVFLLFLFQCDTHCLQEGAGGALLAALSMPHCEPREKISFTLPPL